MDPKPTLFSLALIASSSLAMAGEPTADLIEIPDAIDYGAISGKVQSFLMHRNKEGEGHGTSGTVALTLDYKSPEFSGFSLGGQFVGSSLLYESGNKTQGIDAGYWLSNDEFYLLNEAYLSYDFGHLGGEGAELKVGRQIVNYDFAPTYNIRQKAQAVEGAILKLRPVEGLKIDVGHLERFSSWSSRGTNSDMAWQAGFVDVEDRAGVNYSTSGFQFISAVYDRGPWSFSLYDFYGDDLYNTLGAKASYKWDLGADAGALTFRSHWANQRDVGVWDTVGGNASIDTNVVELGVDWNRGGLTLSGGTVFVNGDRFQTPFRSSFTIDTELLWYTEQFVGETNSAYLKAVYKTDQWLFYTMFVIDEHDDGSDTVCSEVDCVVKYNFNENLYTTVKAGYGYRDKKMGKADTDAIDLRWFFGWTF